MSTKLVTALGLGLFSSAGIAGAEIYQCEEDGMRLLSDRPCESVVEAPEAHHRGAEPDETDAIEQPAEARIVSFERDVQEQEPREQ